jgi:hypothetical protein
MTDDNDKLNSQDLPMEVLAIPDRMVPKLATQVGLAKAGHSLIFNFLHAAPNEKPQLIERIALDIENVRQMAESLKKIMESYDE